MGSQALSSSERSRTYWTQTMEHYFTDLMLDQVHRGNRVGHTFNKQAWTDMLTMLNAKFGSRYEKDALKGRYKSLWEQYNDVKILLEQSGFDWDETQQMVIASNYDWDGYIKIHPDMGCYKTKHVPNFNDLCMIYGYTTADGRYSFSSHDVDIDDDNAGIKIGDGSQIPSTSDRSRTHWTPTMDRFLVDLMLDQLNKGNKIDQTFNKQAWTEMIGLFNEKFESKYRKNVLRSRYKVLRKHYSDMKVLLSESGFTLDDSREMIVDDDCVWDAYIKANPDSRSCKTTTVPDFNDLRMIYGNEIVDERKLRSVHSVDQDDGILRMKTGDGKDNQKLNSSDRPRTYWTPPMDRYLIDLMLDQVYKGNKIDNTFIAHAWTEMTELFNAKFGSQHEKDVLKNRHKSLRKQHNDIKYLLDQGGFVWDETRQMVRADDNVWDAYIKAHPDARSYRIKIAPSYNNLCMIFGTSASGRCSRLSHSIDHENSIPGVIIGEEMGSHDSSGYDILEIYWTPPREHFFLDLMLEQVDKGNKIDNTFKEEAWTNMTTLFNAKFGCEVDEDVLKNQYINFLKQYTDIQILLGENGFSWDDSQQMVIAEDDIWDAYIQVHPDANIYRAMTVPSYRYLCIINGSAVVDRRNNISGDDAGLREDFIQIMVGEEMDTRFPTVCDGSRTYCAPPMDHYFIDLMMKQVNEGSTTDHTFTKQAWSEMITLFNAKFGSQYDKDVLRSRYKNLRKHYNDIKTLLDQTGFAWEETWQMVTANDDAWDAYLQAHPSYNTKTVSDYNSLRAICENANANGKNIHISDDVEFKKGMITTTNGTGKDDKFSTTTDRSRTFWTPSMDHYFIDLMLEEVHGESQTDQAFDKQAWTHMITQFNAKFGSQYNTDVLKSRHKNLRKQFNYITNILNLNGFHWDGRRQMVAADDDIWDAYVKEHPDAQSYRTKISVNYNDLCLIYGNGYTYGRDEHFDHNTEIISDIMDMEISGVSGALQSYDTDIAQRDSVNSMPHFGSDTILSNEQKKRKSRSSISQHSRKILRGDNSKRDTISEMEDVMHALQSIPDIDEDLILDACDLLEDETKGKTFLALDVKLRKKWLLRKLRS